MANKTELKKDANQVNKKSVAPDNVADKKKKTPPKKSSGIVAGAVGRSAVDKVKATSSKDVKGSSGLANTGPVTSYD